MLGKTKSNGYKICKLRIKCVIDNTIFHNTRKNCIKIDIIIVKHGNSNGSIRESERSVVFNLRLQFMLPGRLRIA